VQEAAGVGRCRRCGRGRTGSGSQGATTAAVNAAAVGSAVGGGGTARAVDAGRAV